MRFQGFAVLTVNIVLCLCMVIQSAFSFQALPVFLRKNGIGIRNNVGSIASFRQECRSPSRTTLSLARISGGSGSSSDGDEEEDYRKKLEEAEAAIAAAEEARRKLLLKNNRRKKGLIVPPTSLSRLDYTDAGTLQVTIAPRGLGSDSLFSGAFSLAWFSAIAPATFATGGASLLFMLPFWAAGGLVAKNAVVDPFLAARLTIGQYAWSVENLYLKKVVNQKEGATDELRGAVAELVAVVNNVPKYELRLYGEKGMTAFGLGLSQEELEYLAGEINDHLKKFKDLPDDTLQKVPEEEPFQ